MYFTEGELRSYEQLMRQTPRRPPSKKKPQNTTPSISTFSSPSLNKEKSDEKQK
jgi:hypothetical protein